MAAEIAAVGIEQKTTEYRIVEARTFRLIKLVTVDHGNGRSSGGSELVLETDSKQRADEIKRILEDETS